MGEVTGIEWTDHTFNPWWGCTEKRIDGFMDRACVNCYARTLDRRISGNENHHWGENPRRFFGDRHWNEPLRWNRKAETEGVRRRVFCASMCDVFERRPSRRGGASDIYVYDPINDRMNQERKRLWKLIEETPWLDWQLLTKRPENVMRMVLPAWRFGPTECMDAIGGRHGTGLPPNVWIGTSIVTQKAFDERWPILQEIPAQIIFISAEPLMEEVDFGSALHGVEWGPCQLCGGSGIGGYVSHDMAMDACDMALEGQPVPCSCDNGGDWNQTRALDWLILGGESGPKARPSHPKWFEKPIRDAERAEKPVFFKQWGEWSPCCPERHVQCQRVLRNSEDEKGFAMYRMGKKEAGAMILNRFYKQFPESAM